MAAGDPGTKKRNYSATAIQTTLVNAMTSAATGDTTASVAVVSVSGFPSTVPYTLILGPDTSKEEVVTVTAATSTTLTITRGQDNTQAQSHAAGTTVRHGVSAREFKELQTHIAARGYDTDSAILSGVDTHVHGIVTGEGDVVGTDKAQSLTNKTSITGLVSTGLGATSATPKSYVDAILGSATAASTSATSAATSATSAATSATSSATSATASASSASAAATSASSALTSQTAAATSATSASTSASSAATSATSAATSASSALTSQTAAATSATSASTSASSAATSATTAQAWATQLVTAVSGTDYSAKYNANLAATSAASAATSATSSAASTSAAAASATAAATSATSAAASATAAATSATSAATSASSALTSQTAAATSATSAATSASSALTSQTAAATSATSAATSASSAATTYTAYDARYLGSKTSAPTVDNQGGALITGATYWNSTSSLMYAWSGSAWQAISTTTSYSAPTLGSTTINSGATVSNVNALTINSTTIPTSKTLVDTDSSQTLTNKTLSNGLAAADPTTSLGLATKQYVDAVTTGINFHAPVAAATTANITATYNNGSSGVGATLTVTATGAFILDGVTTVLGDRILVKDQTIQTQNGIYSVTTAGTTGVSAVLTRATDNDNNPVGEMANGDIVNTTGGTANSGKTFVNSTTGTITIGTTNITYSAYYAGLPAMAGSNGLYLKTNGTEPSWSTAVTSVTSASTSRISIGGTASAPTVDLVTTGVTAATYTSTTLTVDAYGRITSASTGASGGAQISDIFLMMGA